MIKQKLKLSTHISKKLQKLTTTKKEKKSYLKEHKAIKIFLLFTIIYQIEPHVIGYKIPKIPIIPIKFGYKVLNEDIILKII